MTASTITLGDLHTAGVTLRHVGGRHVPAHVAALYALGESATRAVRVRSLSRDEMRELLTITVTDFEVTEEET